MSIRTYDTLRKEKVDFSPVEPGKVKMYLCGRRFTDFFMLETSGGQSFLMSSVIGLKKEATRLHTFITTQMLTIKLSSVLMRRELPLSIFLKGILPNLKKILLVSSLKSTTITLRSQSICHKSSLLLMTLLKRGWLMLWMVKFFMKFQNLSLMENYLEKN